MNRAVVLMPDFAFAELAARLSLDGWQKVGQAADSLVPGEPEHASFERGGERIVYSFNPVCAFRVLDASGARAAPALPLADAQAVGNWLAAADERTLLRGVLAAAQLGETSLALQVEALRRHPRRAIAEAAERALHLLQPRPQDDAARGGALLAIEVLKAQLAPMLQALAHDRDGRLAAALQPRPGDGARAFVAGVAEAAEQAYAALPAPRVASIDGDCQLQVALAPAAALADENDLSRQFPSGYRAIAHLLAPHTVWTRWKYVGRGDTGGMAYDGLVWIGERWVWFPKPYRVLSA